MIRRPENLCAGAGKTRGRYTYTLTGSRIAMTKRMIHSYFLHSIIKMNSNHFLMENPDTHSQTKQHSSQRPKNPDNPCQNPQFSDVITLAGTSGLPAAFRTLTLQKQVPKNMTNRSPLNCRLKSRLNRLFSRNNPLKRYFPLAWTPLPREPGNGSLNGQSEPVLRPEYLMSRASGSTHTIRILVVSDILMDPM
jgi:hypothetical protein